MIADGAMRLIARSPSSGLRMFTLGLLTFGRALPVPPSP